MRVRRCAGYESTIHQVLGNIVTPAAVQARRIDLGKAAALDPTLQDVPVTANVRVALDVGKDRDETLQLQLEDDIVDVGGQVLVGQFQQEVRAPVGEGQDVALLHPVGQIGTDEGFVAAQNGQRDGPTVQLCLEVPDSLAYLGWVCLVLVLDPVRRADDGTDAGRRRKTGHRYAGGHVRRAVVQPRQDVTVDVDDAHDSGGVSSGLAGSVL